MAKHIVFCADGTWNNPYEDENAEHSANPTNVYKLFLCLAGSLSLDSLLNSDEQEKGLSDNGRTSLVANYIYGVGDSRNLLNRLLGGAFGAGSFSVSFAATRLYQKLRIRRRHCDRRVQPWCVYGTRTDWPHRIARAPGLKIKNALTDAVHERGFGTVEPRSSIRSASPILLRWRATSQPLFPVIR